MLEVDSTPHKTSFTPTCSMFTNPQGSQAGVIDGFCEAHNTWFTADMQLVHQPPGLTT